MGSSARRDTCAVADQAPASEEFSATYFRERTDAIVADRRARGRAPRYAPPPECDLPERTPTPVLTVAVTNDHDLDAGERRYMDQLRSRQLGEAEAAVLGCLLEGRAKARKSPEIEKLTELSGRAVRSAVETLRINEFPICSATDGDAGYWHAGTGEEFVACIKAQRRRALRQLAVTGAMKRAAAELFGQTVFELDEATT